MMTQYRLASIITLGLIFLDVIVWVSAWSTTERGNDNPKWDCSKNGAAVSVGKEKEEWYQ